MKKFQLLIAEDEIAINNLIKNLIDFTSLNLELAGQAYDGQTAYEMILSSRPNIIITDIAMPGMTGLELIQRVHEENIPAHFIIISGLSCFNHALTAIKMGVEDYLLKPINKGELNDVLEKLILKIASQLKINYQIQKMNLDSHAQAQKLRRSFIMNILYSKDSALHLSLPRLNKEYGFAFQMNTCFSMGLCLIDHLLDLNLAVQNTILEQLMRRFSSAIRDYCIDFEVYSKNHQFIFLLNYHPCHAELLLGYLSAIHQDLLEFIRSYENLTLATCWGVPVSEPKGLSYSLQTAMEILPARLLLGTSRVLSAQQLTEKKADPGYPVPPSELQALRSSIEIRDLPKFQQQLKNLFKNTASGCRLCPHKILTAFCDTMSKVLSELHQWKMITVNITDTYLQYCDAMEAYCNVNELIRFTVSFVQELVPFHQEEENSDNRQIELAKQYIQEHFKENLKLENVAEQIYLAPSYFGVLFKKEVGESFSCYLTSVRMEKAKELLHDIRYNIAEIAGQVGYQDKRYFSRLFKEQVGVTPKEYRKIYAD